MFESGDLRLSPPGTAQLRRRRYVVGALLRFVGARGGHEPGHHQDGEADEGGCDHVLAPSDEPTGPCPTYWLEVYGRSRWRSVARRWPVGSAAVPPGLPFGTNARFGPLGNQSAEEASRLEHNLKLQLRAFVRSLEDRQAEDFSRLDPSVEFRASGAAQRRLSSARQPRRAAKNRGRLPLRLPRREAQRRSPRS